MTKENSLDPSYSLLLERIRKEITEGLERAQKAYDKEKILTYWKIGQSIHKHFLENKIQADFGKRIIKTLSKDLNLGEPLLYQMIQFYKAYPKLEPSLNLKWSHYRLLSSVKDESKRTELEEKIAIENLSKRNLEVLVKDERISLPVKPSGKKPRSQTLRTVKGKLYTYKLLKMEYSENYFIDLGFNISKESEITNPDGYFIESIKNEAGEYKFKAVLAMKKDLYTYKAYVLKVIDGDTIWLNIDLGFTVWIQHKVRLRGIDTAEVTTKEGKEAFEYVKTVLKSVPFVVVKSFGRDKFDRFLMDIYYLPGEEDERKVLENGNFINQELLNKGLAQIFVD